MRSPDASHRRLDASFRIVYNQMVVQLTGYAMTSSDRLDATFAALADPTRRAILARLASGEASVNELAEPFSMSLVAGTASAALAASKPSPSPRPQNGSRSIAASGWPTFSASTLCSISSRSMSQTPKKRNRYVQDDKGDHK
jgi:DNA-binding transcriptional ArsR family regulator